MSFYASAALPWTVSEEDEERFRQIQKRLLIFFFILSVLMPFLPVPKVEQTVLEEIPERLVKLALELRQAPPPPVTAQEPEALQEKLDSTKAEPKEIKKEKIEKVEVEKRVELARKKASHSGLLALKDELADLRDTSMMDTLQKAAKSGPGLGDASGPGVGNSRGPALGEGARAIITSGVASGSGGINTSKLSRGTGGGGLAGRSTTQVNSPMGGGGGSAGGTLRRGGSGKAGRSIEEIQLVFDKNKSAIYSIYNRALRENPALQGKVLLKITINPDGRVLSCSLVSSDLHSPEVERKLIARIVQFDFGAKDVDVMVVTYPIDFLPS